jgi:putative ABC transport system ATP-binding protein
VIDVTRLEKTYALGDASPVAALRGVSFRVDAGELVSIMGASGSGKSTLLNLLGCLDRPTAGEYLLDGVEAGRLDANGRAELRNSKIGFVFQSFNLLPRTSAIENVELPLVYGHVPTAEHRPRAEAALAAVGLGGLGDRLPTQLSGGQQQRVAIVIVTHDPHVARLTDRVLLMRDGRLVADGSPTAVLAGSAA